MHDITIPIYILNQYLVSRLLEVLTESSQEFIVKLQIPMEDRFPWIPPSSSKLFFPFSTLSHLPNLASRAVFQYIFEDAHQPTCQLSFELSMTFIDAKFKWSTEATRCFGKGSHILQKQTATQTLKPKTAWTTLSPELTAVSDSILPGNSHYCLRPKWST